MKTPAPHHGPEGWAAGVGTAKNHRFFYLMPQPRSMYLPAFSSEGTVGYWGDGRREGPRAGVCPARNDPDDPILPEATAPSDRHGIAADRTGPGPRAAGRG
jgi:hypothetical protein